MFRKLRSFRALSPIMALLIVSSTIGIPSVKHYCSGKWVSTHFSPKESCHKKQENPFACCLEKQSSSIDAAIEFEKKCCNNEASFQKIDSECLIDGQIIDHDVKDLTSVEPRWIQYDICSPVIRLNLSCKEPPPPQKYPLRILYQQFRC